MLIHLQPTFLTCGMTGPNCQLVDLAIPELGVSLQGGRDLATRRPFPNKNYLVACRKSGQKAIAGILLETPRQVRAFTMIARWAVDAEFVVRHQVDYEVLDEDFDAASEDMVLWYRRADEAWEARFPQTPAGGMPANLQPRMDVSQNHQRLGDVRDRVVDGRILERRETFKMHTVERERILSEKAGRDRLPKLSSAFKADA